MTSLLSPLPVLLLVAATATVQAGNAPTLLPARLTPAGLRLQATFAAVRPDQGMAVFSLDGQTRLQRAGSDLGNGLQLLGILADRVVLAHGNAQYYLPIRMAAATDPHAGAAVVTRQASPARAAISPASRNGLLTPTGRALQAGNLDEVRQQCQSSAMTQLSAAQRQEIQSLGLCP